MTTVIDFERHDPDALLKTINFAVRDWLIGDIVDDNGTCCGQAELALAINVLAMAQVKLTEIIVKQEAKYSSA